MNKAKDSSHVHNIGCLEAIEGLYAWLDGELDDAVTLESIEQHIGHCHSCYSRAQIEKILTVRIRESARDQVAAAAPESLHHRFVSLMKNFQ